MHAPHATRQPARRLAQASIGAVHLGIPVEAVVQAIALPGTPAFLPRRQGALRGVVDHLGSLVPVVDLARWVDVGQSAPSIDARILVLRDGARTIGLQVDAVGGLVDIEARHFTRLHHDDNPEDVFQTAVRSPENGRVLSLLEVGRLADLALAWSQAERADETPHAGSPAAARRLRTPGPGRCWGPAPAAWRWRPATWPKSSRCRRWNASAAPSTAPTASGAAAICPCWRRGR